MIIADTSIWIDYLRKEEATLEALLLDGEVLMHPFVLGEIALGHLPNRTATLTELHHLPTAKVANEAEVLRLIEVNDVAGTGVGYIDVHLIASALLMDCALWTRDKRLARLALSIGRSPLLH